MVGKSVGSEEADGRRGWRRPFLFQIQARSRATWGLGPKRTPAGVCREAARRAGIFVGTTDGRHLDAHTTPPPKVQQPNGRTPGRPCEARSLAEEGCQGLSRKTRPHETTLAGVGPPSQARDRATHPTWRGWRAAKDRGPRIWRRAQPPGGWAAAPCAHAGKSNKPPPSRTCQRLEQTRKFQHGGATQAARNGPPTWLWDSREIGRAPPICREELGRLGPPVVGSPVQGLENRTPAGGPCALAEIVLSRATVC